MEAWYTTALDIEEVLSGALDFHVHVFVADVVNPLVLLIWEIMDRVLSSLGLPAWFGMPVLKTCACSFAV